MLAAALIFVMEALGAPVFHDLLEQWVPGVWARAVVVGLGAWAVFLRWRELKHSAQRPVFATAMRLLFRELAALKFEGSAEQKKDTLQNFSVKVLITFFAVFEHSKTSLTVMLADGEGVLRIACRYPGDHPYDMGFTLKSGEGAGGMAYEKGKAMYVPAIRYSHGVSISFPEVRIDRATNQANPGSSPSAKKSATSPKRPTLDGSPGDESIESLSNEPDYDLEPNIYKKSDVEPFRSILSVPIVGSQRTLGVVNFDSSKKAPYNDTDMSFAEVAAAALAMLIDRHNATH